MTATGIIELLTEDHQRLEQLCTELELGQGSPENRRDLADHLTAEVVRHTVAEEPYLPDGLGELAEADGLMRRLEGVGPQQTRFETLLSALIRAVRRHVRNEAPRVLEKLGSEHTPEQMRELGKDVARARRNSRFLPHPAMADRLPGEDMLRPGPGFVDRARSALSQPG